MFHGIQGRDSSVLQTGQALSGLLYQLWSHHHNSIPCFQEPLLSPLIQQKTIQVEMKKPADALVSLSHLIA